MPRFFKKKDDKNVKKRGSGLFKRRKFCRRSVRISACRESSLSP